MSFSPQFRPLCPLIIQHLLWCCWIWSGTIEEPTILRMFANFTSFVASFILGSFIVSFFFKNWEIFGFTHQKYKIFRRRKDTLSTDHVAQKLKFYRGCRAWHYVVSVSLCETISRPLIGEKLSRINVLRHLI